MKKSSLTLLSMLALAGPAFGQLASDIVSTSSGGSGTHQFVENEATLNLTLCTHELCRVDENGYLKVDFVAAGSVSNVIAQASDPDAQNYLVFYPAGHEGNAEKRRVLRNRYLVRLTEGADLEAIKTRCGMESISLFHEGSDIAICEELSAGRALSQLTNVLSDPQVTSAQAIFAKKRDKRAIPTDPFYASTSPAGVNENYQWYLNNEGVNGGAPNIDINLETALDSATGSGVVVAVVDDGVAIDHEDLVANATGPHLNLFGDAAPDDPATFDGGANHGTAVAGLIGARFNNGTGISGVAPQSTLAGIRLLPGTDGGDRLIDDFEEAAALLHALGQVDIYNNSWGPSDNTLDLAAPGPLVEEALMRSADTGRMVGGSARGSIFVWAGGNGGENLDRSDYDGYANSKYTIAVSALDDAGKRSSYSEEGSNIVVAAPSSGGSQGVLTTSFGLGFDEDNNQIRTSEYVSDFGGTSASAPLVSGVVALMLEENPELNWREVQDILIRSAVKVDASDGDWIDNAAGLSFNHKYGAGLVDASAAVALADPMSGRVALGDAVRNSHLRVFSGNPNNSPDISGVIPDNDGSSLLVAYDMTQDGLGNPLENLKVEHVELRARIITQRRADLEIVLISPNGTQSTLHAVDQNNTEESITNWTFMTVRNWGEGSAGTWVVRITDRVTGNPAIFQNATLHINGVADATAPVLEIPILTSSPVITLNQDQDFSYIVQERGAETVAVGGLPSGVTFDPATNTISGAFPDAGLFAIPIVLTDSAGAEGSFRLSAVVRPTAVALGDAVGLVGTPAVFGGDAPWDFEFVDTNSAGAGGDGISARSAVGLADNQSSVFGFNNLGEGVLMFDWKTSSEAGADRLWFNRGGEVPHTWDAFISGPREWATSAVVLPDSSNNVRWIYAKDPAKLDGVNSVGEDRGLVDNIQLIEGDKYLEDLINAGPIEGFDPEFDSRAIFYPKAASAASAAPGETAGVALASPALGNGQTASMSGWLEGPGTLSLAAVMYAHSSDVFEILIDGVLDELLTLPGNVVEGREANFRIYSLPIPEGRHRVELRFRKDFSEEAFGVFEGKPFEGVLLDDVKFTSASSFSSFLTEVDQTFDDGDAYSFFEEYAFGGDLTAADIPKYLPSFVTSGGKNYLEYGFNTALTNLQYTAQESSDLNEWRDVQLSMEHRMEGDVQIYRVPVTSVAGRSSLYFRVVVEER